MTEPVEPTEGAPAPPVTRATARWLWPLIGLAALGATGVAATLVDEVVEGGSFKFDRALLLALRRPGDLHEPIGPRWLQQSAIDISALGGFTLLWLLGGVSLLFLVSIRRRAEAAWLGGSLVGASLLNSLLKAGIHRARPDLVPHLAQVTNASFPSGHAMISAAVYLTVAAMLAEVQPRVSTRTLLVTTAGALVLLIGCSRVYLGVHWPSDVLAGWCLGAVWALVAFAANRVLRRRMRGPGVRR